MIGGPFLIVRKGNKTDPNAAAFLQVTGITDPTISSAINTLCKSLKAAGLWDSIYMLKPYVGGTAVTHSYNLINTALYQSTFFGGVTHNSNGINGNGVNGYENTGCTPNLFPQNSVSIGFYVNGVSNQAVVDMGLVQSTILFYIECKNGAGSNVIGLNNSAFSSIVNTNTNGFYMACRENSTTIKSYYNTTLLQTYTKTSTTPPSIFIPVMAYNNGGSISLYSNRNYRTSFIAGGFTNNQVITFYNIIQTFQTTLGRQV